MGVELHNRISVILATEACPGARWTATEAPALTATEAPALAATEAPALKAL
jgi:hypothetical protein